ncbi:TMV resistance protein N-like [Ziziphus jujuba]|uniref:ADP-ribosyl cyclase/cyclic ADP-ribose hydrolase n=1 Tax=Ziziphus jujuba TaxID=326968 RepID=A0A6P4AKS7_ZIZJJ|nr:TMV resistance protein N-like [Ziziphus jujuba]XP_048320366.2 TMV resistance protein N-like [Ziziphus jujuba]XP_048320367.2 TMV resistance protein N-like [Ziziphus jujuba]XP_048320368.2 TMV resistance protein N-like [Ziziphus jujuba]XP_048320369.2 TMV resistance protein N-like [Ziziphus jujuba]XP_048320371.2 TMV resistance protein N-like [Ziziphus jujuba]XP_048320372.2 TMV resistance protein N-like [Ziziphus jujuba]XP_048320373.2 TMV resistance protein N-like [Ziziphus jujuba]XP_04832037
MAASSSSSSSSTISPQQKHEIQEKYDVFLSFRGEDTRYKFVSHLYAALSAKYISTFKDDHELQVGDEISPTLSQAIQNSKIGVIIFSKEYASSTWCLNELVEILECKKRNKMGVVVPIFYEINPSDVRKQKGSYEVAFAKLEERFKDRMEKVHQWRAALTEASNLTGLNSTRSREECELVEEIVENILKILLQYQPSVEQYSKRLIGIKENIREIERDLSIAPKNVRIVGIWGMAGIGKTTLARVVFDKISNSQSFEGCCFLEDVKENYKVPVNLNRLRKEVISCLLNDKIIQEMHVALPPIIFQRLRRKKVLIVLDDVDSSDHIKAFVEEGCCELAPGSRIIVTTRDEQVLKTVADSIHKVKRLNDIESLDLFRLHAFRENSPTIDDEMVLEVIRYADGNPLALKVLGSSLYSTPKDEWESALKKLKRNQNLGIKKVLKISYDGLDDGSKDIFLDIAFLFNSSFTRDHAERILGDGNSPVKIEIRILIQKCLIENSEGNKLKMHDLLRQMGREIVRDEDKKEPGNRSRLCDAVEVCDVLENCTGTGAVELISLDMFETKKNVTMHHRAFSNMRNLRILKVYYGYDDIARNEWIRFDYNNIGSHKFKLFIPQALHSHLSIKLRFLQWDLYLSKSLPSKFIPENLVELVLRGSPVEKLWNSRKAVSLPELRRFNLSDSKFLTQLPDLTHAPNLERINLAGCTSLVQVHSSLQNLNKLTYLNFNGCSKLRDVEEIFKRTEGLSESWIQNFKRNLRLYSSQAHISQKFAPNLRYLGLRKTAIEKVPPSIGCLSGIVQLHLELCKRLKSLPTSICHLKALKSLSLLGCEKLKRFPEILDPMEHLTELVLTRTGIKELPESIEKLVSLRDLFMDECKDLEFLPNSLCKLRNLERIWLGYCSKFQKLPSLPPSLIVLCVDDCQRLKSLPEVPSQCLSLSAINCTSLENISNWRSTPLLLDLDIFEKFNLLIFNHIDFYGCEKLDQNTRNMLSDQAVIHILSRLKFGLNALGAHSFRYPGGEIPEWFNHQTCETSINNIMLPPYWNNDDFLGFAFCSVLRQNIINPSIYLDIDCKFNSETIDDNRLYEYHFCTNVVNREVSSDHVLMWYVRKPTLQEEMAGLNWPSTCSTEAFFHIRHKYSYLSEYGNESDEIKKFGVRFLYKQDIERLDAKTE